jgi:hypothetical protein
MSTVLPVFWLLRHSCKTAQNIPLYAHVHTSRCLALESGNVASICHRWGKLPMIAASLHVVSDSQNGVIRV